MSATAELVHPFTPLKLLRHSDRVESMIRGDVVYPVSVELDLSNTCNHGCPWCSFNGFRQENWVQWPTDRAFTLLEELADCGVKSITFTGGGEPLTHKDAARLFTHCHALGMQFGVVTNGRLLIGQAREVIASYATFVRISLDAGTAQTHQLLHATARPEYTAILANIKATRELAGDRLTIGAAFCVFDVNVGEIGLAATHVRNAGGNYLEVRPVFPTEWRGGGFARALSPENVEQAQRTLEAVRETAPEGFKVIGMIQRFEALNGADRGFSGCHIGPLTTVINADGYIYHCCIQRGMPNFRAGSVLDRPFKDVWWDAQHQAMVKDIDVAKCPPCRYAGYNRLIEQGFLKDGLHAAFV